MSQYPGPLFHAPMGLGEPREGDSSHCGSVYGSLYRYLVRAYCVQVRTGADTGSGTCGLGHGAALATSARPRLRLCEKRAKRAAGACSGQRGRECQCPHQDQRHSRVAGADGRWQMADGSRRGGAGFGAFDEGQRQGAPGASGRIVNSTRSATGRGGA